MGSRVSADSHWDEKWGNDELIFINEDSKDGEFGKKGSNDDTEDDPQKHITRSMKYIRETWNVVFDDLPVKEKDVEKELLKAIPQLDKRTFKQTRERIKRAQPIFDTRHSLRILQPQSKFIIGTYCENHIYSALNRSLRDKEYTTFQLYCKELVKALRALPYERTTGLYRGVPTKMSPTHSVRPWTMEDFSVGQLLTWRGFTSTSKDYQIAKKFAGPNGVIFHIKVDTGRNISTFSMFYEEEVLLLPLTLMKIQKVKKVKQNIVVHCEEVQIWKGKHCVLWIDDHPENNFGVMQAVEKETDVNFVMVHSTEEAMRFMMYRTNSDLFDLSLNNFRIVTDMHRDTEGDDERDVAGAVVCNKLRAAGYKNTIMMFVSNEPRTVDKLYDRGFTLKNVQITSHPQKVLDFCCFSDASSVAPAFSRPYQFGGF